MTQDNGARALSEAMANAMPDWRDRPSYVHGWGTAVSAMLAILANGAAFLPDAAELERLRAALREVLDRIDYINGPDAREVLQRARAALAPEGSARDGG